jgi:hypothetical protein
MQRKSFMQQIGCFSILLMVFSLPFFSIGLYETGKEVLLKSSGEVAVAQVIGKDYSYSNTNRGAATITYSVQYKFKSSTRDSYDFIEGESQIDGDAWNDIEKGDNISIIYSTSNPNISRVAGKSYFVFGLIFLIVGSLGILGSIVLVISDVKKYKMIENLEQNGVSIEGKIIKIEDVGRLRNMPHSVLHYSFLNPSDGSEIAGKTDYLPTKFLKEYSEGSEINLIYNSDKPTEHYWPKEQEILDSED